MDREVLIFVGYLGISTVIEKHANNPFMPAISRKQQRGGTFSCYSVHIRASVKQEADNCLFTSCCGPNEPRISLRVSAFNISAVLEKESNSIEVTSVGS
jgi:hypothetical protein